MVSEDGLVVSAQIRGDRKERYIRHRDERPEGASKSEFLRNLIDAGLDTREQSVYTRLGCKPKLRTAVENLREPEQEREDIIVQLLREAAEARDVDSVEALVNDDLRDRITAIADEGEPVDDAARRLLREGVEAKESENKTVYGRVSNIIGLLVVFVVPLLFAAQGDFNNAILVAVIYAIIIEFADEINDMFSRLKGLAWRVVP